MVHGVSVARLSEGCGHRGRAITVSPGRYRRGMIDVTTTITVNGQEGDRFLASLTRYRAPVPRALTWLVRSQHRSIEVDRNDADEVADFVAGLLDAGWIDIEAPPLLFSPRVGDPVLICEDVLVEVARHMPGTPPSPGSPGSAGHPLATWRFLPAGMTGKVLGYKGEERVIVDVRGTERRLVVYMTTRWLTRR